MSNDCLYHIEASWKAKTAAANELFDKKIFEDALSLYKDALAQAEILNNNLEECISIGVPSTQVYVISCNNMANTFVEMKRKEQAENMLKRAIHYLLHLSEKAVIKTDEIQSELNRSVMEYISFIEKNDEGNHDQETLFRQISEQLKENRLIFGSTIKID